MMTCPKCGKPTSIWTSGLLSGVCQNCSEAEVKALEKRMREAAKALEFEKAAELRDRLRGLRSREFGLK